MTVVTRFPPSPTGFMHVGNARTALFNWLFARANKGKFVVRIEDTDRKRHSEEAVQVIMNGLAWMELDYDGEVVSQFSMQERHREVAEQMIEKGQAYYCYCSPEELEEMREKAKKDGSKTFYDRRWRDADPATTPKDIKPVVRIKAPLDGVSIIDDKIQGEIKVSNDQIDDFIILRSDGTPTYMLSVVVDDHDAGVTHIIRGDDHINNAFRQKVIFDAMDWDVPIMAHTPLIHGADGAKFSKRHGAQSVQEFKEMGYLMEGFCNYLLRLGWSHGDEEIIPRDKAVEWFNLESIGRSPAKFDFAKLDHVNAYYIQELDADELIDRALPFYKDRHGIELDEVSRARIKAGIKELKERSKTLVQFVDESVFYAKKTPLSFDEKAKDTLAEADDVLVALKDAFAPETELTAERVQEICKSVAADLREGKLGKVAMPLRAALTGTTVSPSIFEAAAILGKEETCHRINSATQAA
ncbi:MAG: glutamate--tRNA ligase [Alphaproteobacteria bacterium]|nr:glutamate--tRNA ligase [Alphaproteobacteria bacterium]